MTDENTLTDKLRGLSGEKLAMAVRCIIADKGIIQCDDYMDLLNASWLTREETDRAILAEAASRFAFDYERPICAAVAPNTSFVPCLSVLYKTGNYTGRILVESQKAPQSVEEFEELKVALKKTYEAHYRYKNDLTIISFIELTKGETT